MINRCLNLDWLEVYCLESYQNYPHDAEFFRAHGWNVREREYGTRVYDEMFTLEDNDGQPFLEFRRKPVSLKATSGFQVLDPMSCHLRLVNRYCYFDNAADLLAEFLERYHFTFSRISRVDLALDFERFDSGDDPCKFVRRYLKRKFAKINQANISAHGKDMWDGIDWNSLSWGSPSSAVNTKLYDKTMEIREHEKGRTIYKPWIRQQWCAAHLIEDIVTMTKTNKQGIKYKPRIWRLEFSIKSEVKGWMSLETTHGEKNKYLSIRNTLNCYTDKHSMLNIFASLQHHYFFFVYFDGSKRKYDCKEKKLFIWEEQTQFMKIERPLVSPTGMSPVEKLRMMLITYREKTLDSEAREAADTIIEKIERTIALGLLDRPGDKKLVKELQAILSYKINSETTLSNEEVRQFVRTIMDEEKIF